MTTAKKRVLPETAAMNSKAKPRVSVAPASKVAVPKLPKKPAAKKPTVKKSITAKSVAAQPIAAKKVAAKAVAAKVTPRKVTPKVTAKKATAKKATAKKATAKKATAKKVAPKKVASNSNASTRTKATLSVDNRRRSKQAALVEETGVSSESNLTALSEAEIVRVARSIIAEVGVRGFTMRRLSTELGVALGATYHHVATKNALLALVAQDLYNDVSKPNDDVGTWEERLRSLMITQATVAAGYPGMGNFMMTHAAEIVPTDLNKLVRSILSENGFNDREMGTLMGALFYYVTGISAVFSSPTAKLFGSRKVTRLFEDGLDLLIAGAKVRQKEERKKQRS